jgi:hypothetical protein
MKASNGSNSKGKITMIKLPDGLKKSDISVVGPEGYNDHFNKDVKKKRKSKDTDVSLEETPIKIQKKEVKVLDEDIASEFLLDSSQKEFVDEQEEEPVWEDENYDDDQVAQPVNLIKINNSHLSPVLLKQADYLGIRKLKVHFDELRILKQPYNWKDHITQQAQREISFKLSAQTDGLQDVWKIWINVWSEKEFFDATFKIYSQAYGSSVSTTVEDRLRSIGNWSFNHKNERTVEELLIKVDEEYNFQIN